VKTIKDSVCWQLVSATLPLFRPRGRQQGEGSAIGVVSDSLREQRHFSALLQQ